MRVASFAFPLLLVASPLMAQAQPTAAPQAPQPPQTVAPQIQIPPQLFDPQLPARLGRVSQALGKVLLDMPIGEIEAAAEGRKPTRADRRRTVRSVGRAEDPNFERDLERDLAQSGVMFEAAMRALATSLPAMVQGLQQAGQALEAATRNLPPPTPPTR